MTSHAHADCAAAAAPACTHAHAHTHAHTHRKPDGEQCPGRPGAAASSGCCGGGSGAASASAASRADAASAVEREVRSIQKANVSAAERSRRIHAVFSRQRELAASVARRANATPKGVFPGAGAPHGCAHYTRKCWIRAECCQRYYACRRCHDEHETHEIDRRATRVVACVVCGDADQPVAASCRTCGVRFARYFCEPCRLYNDAPDTAAYHCDKCGICRAGRAEDNYHCDACGTCMPVKARHSHTCRRDSVGARCPICSVWLATSTDECVVLPCSHAIHVSCLKSYMKTSISCPICAKCVTKPEEIRPWYQMLDQRLAQDVMPAELANRVARVLCNDCETKTVTRFHFKFHRCGDCRGYNTKVLEHYDVDPSELPPSIAQMLADEAEAASGEDEVAEASRDARGDDGNNVVAQNEAEGDVGESKPE